MKSTLLYIATLPLLILLIFQEVAAADSKTNETQPPVDNLFAPLTPMRKIEMKLETQGSGLAPGASYLLQTEGKKYRIEEVTFECNLPSCENEEGRKTYIDVSGLKRGDDVTVMTLSSARKRLLETQRFYAINFDVENDEAHSNAKVHIHGIGAKTIRRISFEGLVPPPFESELRKLLTFRRGQQFPANRSALDPQIESFKKALREAGIYNADVALEVNNVKGEPFMVDLVYKFENGTRYNICNVGIRGLNTLSYNDASDALLSDASFLESRLNLFDLEYSANLFSNGQDALLKKYRQRGFLNAQIVQKTTFFSPKKKCAYLAVDVVEGPHWEILFHGAEHFSDNELEDALPLLDRSYVDQTEIDRSSAALKALYQTRGFPFTEVNGEIKFISEIQRQIIFTINEGPRLEIRSIELQGNKHFSDEKIMKQMGTTPYSLFANGGFLQTEQLIDDLSKIESFYHENGFLNAVVSGFQIIIEDEELKIIIDIDENNPTILTNVTFEKDAKLPASTTHETFELKEGEPFTSGKLQKDLNTLKVELSKYGYAAAKVSAVCVTPDGREVACTAPRFNRECVGEGRGIPNDLSQLPKSVCVRSDDNTKITCRRYRRDPNCKIISGINSDAVKTILRVNRGPQVTVGPIVLQGNNLTKDYIILRELEFQRGDFVDTDEIVRSQGNLRDLNIFESVSIESIGVNEKGPNDTSIVAPMLVTVEERPVHNFSVQLGFEIRDFIDGEVQYLLTGETSYTNRNILGYAQSIQPHLIAAIDPVNLIRMIERYSEGTKPPISSLNYLFGAELTYSDPRLMKDWFGVDRLLLTVSPYFLIDLVGITDGTNLREEWGLRAELRKYFYFDTFRIYGRFGTEIVQSTSHAPDDPVVNGERIFSPRRLVGKITPEVGFDSRDSPLNPTKGYFIRIIPEFFTGDALKKGRETIFRDSFIRLQFQASYFFNFWSEVVLGQSLRYGQIIPLGGRTELVPSTERFYLGGVRSVRGFPNASLGPTNRMNQSPTGGEFMLNYNIELRYPIISSIGLFGATFFDAGILSNCRIPGEPERHCFKDAFDENFIHNLRTSAGIGIRFLVLDQIPIVLDYGVVLNRQPTEKFGQFNFNIGYTFD